MKVALITGGSAGIGQATAIEFAKLGYRVAITGRKQEKLDNTLSLLKDAVAEKSLNPNDIFFAIRVDFEDMAQVEKMIESVVMKFNQLDVLINNAGYLGKNHGLGDADFFEDFKSIIQVNLMAATRIAQLSVPHLIKTKGVIINVSSVADRVPIPNISYSVSKAGLSMLTKTLANALGDSGVRVVTVSPGPIKTDISDDIATLGYTTLLNRVGDANEVTNLITFLCSDKASFITGCTMDVDGGYISKFGGLFNHMQLKSPE